MTVRHKTPHPYEALTPEIILDAVESYEVQCTGGLLALNSYENRVYRVDTENNASVVAKFYRPGRWQESAILEEHRFAWQLAEHEIPVVAPLVRRDGSTCNYHGGFRFAVYPWQPGRAPELNTRADRALLGRYLGRLHRLGSAEPFRHRRRLSIEEFGHGSVHYLKQHQIVPEDLRDPFFTITEYLFPPIESAFRAADEAAWIRLHGDCHLGNILWTETGPHLVDFDDCLTGPAVQDLWMLLSGENDEMESQLADVLSGYTPFMEFNPVELRLIEPLRTLRMLRYMAWLAERWDDPAFPHNFPWFNTRRYWEEQILALKQQAAALDEPPLSWLA
ncbi:MAG: serine/threonine protein kinase [Sulfuricaulis sp.]|uniref:serine/threonine protein kinase n=1 Tax=Sulfuricaulis sp. TaxID=2003553 RepID=UPI0034A3EA1B